MAADESIQAYLTVYESPEQDKYLKELNYDNFFACKYSSDDLEFELFAYQFQEMDSAKEYFNHIAGHKATDDTDFLKSAGMTSYKSVVISGNTAYAVYSKRSDVDKLNELLGYWFTNEVVFFNGQAHLQPKDK